MTWGKAGLQTEFVPHLPAATRTTCGRLLLLPLQRKGVYQSLPSRVSAKHALLLHHIPRPLPAVLGDWGFLEGWRKELCETPCALIL